MAFDPCCGFMNLRLGAIIVGWLQVIINAMTTIFEVLPMISKDLDFWKQRGGIWAYLDFACAVGIFVVAILLLIGIYNANRTLVTIYLIFMPIALILLVVMSIFTVYQGAIPIGGLFLFLHVYFTLVVCAYDKHG